MRIRVILRGRNVENTAAILLRKTLLSDTSLIVTWLTERQGKIKTVARGARRPKSPFTGKLDLFFDVEIQWARSKKSELHTLREAVVREPFEGLRAQYLRTLLAAHFVELVELVTELEHAAPELYDLLQRAFTYLNNGKPTRRALLHFESELARLTGIQGQPGVTPAAAIGRAFGRLPAGRAELLERLA